MNNGVSKVLVIGAGIGQVHIVQLAKAKGLYTIVVSPMGNYPAIPIADELFECDIYNREKIVEFAKEQGVVAVLSDQNDLMMPTVAFVAEKLGLPGNSFEQTMSYCDKTRFREVCDEIGVPVPKHITVCDNEVPDLDVSLPWIVKPADSQSNIGITKIEDKTNLEPAVRVAISKSKQKKAIVEQFFQGKEYVCEGFVFDGKYYLINFGDRRYFSGTLIPSQTLFPSCLSQDIQQKIIECEQKVANAIHPNFGIIHSEYMVNLQTGEIRAIESAIRGGGVFISSHLIPLSTGIDVNSLLLECALGHVSHEQVEDIIKTRKERASAYVCFTLPKGVINSVDGTKEIMALPGIEMCDLHNIAVGMQTEPMQVKGSRKGPILVSADSREELENRIDKIKQTLNVTVLTTTGNLENVIWE